MVVSDSTPITNSPRPIAERRLRQLITPFVGADDRRAWFQLVTTGLLFVAGWGVMAVGVRLGWNYGLVLLLALPVAGLYVRLFILQHDCGHGSFFSSQLLNDAVGRVLGVVTLMPYAYWRHTHAIHHATSGNLDRRGIGDIVTLTVSEYRAAGLVEARRLSFLPQHAGTARPRTAVPVRTQASPATGPAALAPEGMGQHLDQQRRAFARDNHAFTGLRLADSAAGAPAGIAPVGSSRSVAVLRATPVRKRLLVEKRWVEHRALRCCGQLSTTTCRRSCAGSAATSATTTCITSRPASRIIGFGNATTRTRSCNRPRA